MGTLKRLEFKKVDVDPSALAKQISAKYLPCGTDRIIDEITRTHTRNIAVSHPEKFARQHALRKLKHDHKTLIDVILTSEFEDTVSEAKGYIMELVEHIKDPKTLFFISSLGVTDADKVIIARYMAVLEPRDTEMLRFIVLNAENRVVIENTILAIRNLGQYDVIADINANAKFLAEYSETGFDTFTYDFTLTVLEANIDSITSETALIAIVNETKNQPLRRIAAAKLADMVDVSDEINLFANANLELLICVVLYHVHDKKWEHTVGILSTIWADTILERLETEMPPDYMSALCLACYSDDPEHRKTAYNALPLTYAEEVAIRSKYLDSATTALDRFDPERDTPTLRRISEQATIASIREMALEKWFFTAGF
ncbi:MAG: hypothetical protein ABH842_02065 [Candidatus Micrarchaeota archaeon]